MHTYLCAYRYGPHLDPILLQRKPFLARSMLCVINIATTENYSARYVNIMYIPEPVQVHITLLQNTLIY